MRSHPSKSATRRRLEAQLERLGTLGPDACVASLRPLAEDSTRFNVRIGRVQVGPVHAEDIEALGLAVGAPASGGLLERLGAALAREAARTDALRLLRARARTRHDLIGRLMRKGHDRADAASAVDRLARVGLVDDASLARDRAERLASGARLGPRGAEARLRTMGLGAALSAEAVAGAYAGVDLLEQATSTARKRAASLSPDLDDRTRRARLFGFLARRGYDHETCRGAVERALGSAPED